MNAHPTTARSAVLALALAAALGAAVVSTSAATPRAAQASHISAAPARCGGQVATVVGTAGDDVLVGTPGRDVIAALGGDDEVRAGAGDDLVCGGRGADRLHGEVGDDTLLAGPARRIENRAGVGFAPDVLDGGPGDDTLDIGPEPGAGGHLVSGEIRFGSAPSAVVVDLAAGTATGDGVDTIVRRPGLRLVGTPGDDVLAGSDLPEEIRGEGGADTIRGRAGADRLYGDARGAVEGPAGAEDDDLDGGPGKDVLAGTVGADALRGGPGLDLVEATGAGPSQVRGGTGDDFLLLTLGETGGDGAALVGGPGRDDVTIDVRRGAAGRPLLGVRMPGYTLALDGLRVGRIAGVERVRAADRVAMEYVGTAAPDTVFAGLRGRLRARTYAGEDVVLGSRRADSIDTGAGRDEADGRGGRDFCVRVEHARSCERGPSAGRLAGRSVG